MDKVESLIKEWNERLKANEKAADKIYDEAIRLQEELGSGLARLDIFICKIESLKDALSSTKIR